MEEEGSVSARCKVAILAVVPWAGRVVRREECREVSSREDSLKGSAQPDSATQTGRIGF